MMEFKEKGKTMFFVSHSISQMKKFCDQILWLEFGVVKEYGPTKEVIAKYETFLAEYKALSKADKKKYRTTALDRQSKKNTESAEVL